MFLLLLYWLFTPILWILVLISSFLNPKIRHHWINEKNTWLSAQKKYQNNNSKKIIVQFHAASNGEFEQLKPILEKLSREKFFIIQSFFSPTVYIKEKKYHLVDAICYHPFDFFWKALYFFRLLKIDYYITTRNDIWPTHLYIAKYMGIKTILINANIYRESHYKSYFLKHFYRRVLGKFDLILTGSDRLKKNLLHLIPENKIYITGDSRLDRVLQRKTKLTDELLPKIYNESKTIILGSVDPSDYAILFAGLKKYYPKGNESLDEKNHRLIIVPHEIDSKNLNILNNYLRKTNFDSVYYSDRKKINHSRVVIINKVGILADLYKYANLAYIGEGFKDCIHSVIEPAIYYNAISFGPKYHIVDMAVNLIDMNLSTVIYSGNDFYHFIKLLDNDKEINKIHNDMKEYISNQQLASEKIINTIFEND